MDVYVTIVWWHSYIDWSLLRSYSVLKIWIYTNQKFHDVSNNGYSSMQNAIHIQFCGLLHITVITNSWYIYVWLTGYHGDFIVQTCTGQWEQQSTGQNGFSAHTMSERKRNSFSETGEMELWIFVIWLMELYLIQWLFNDSHVQRLTNLVRKDDEETRCHFTKASWM